MDKPFKTIEEQIKTLSDRGVATDESTATALLTENYYAVVNGYKEPFLIRSADEERYKPHTHFNDIYNLFLFDRRLRQPAARRNYS